MDEAEVADLLGTGGVGVVSFARDDDAYSIPVSYGFDQDGPALYLRLGFGPDSDKREYVGGRGEVSLVVFEDDDRWQSVVARGHLEEVTESALDATVAEALREVDIPLVDIFDRAPRDVEFTVYRLRPDVLTGRKEPA